MISGTVSSLEFVYVLSVPRLRNAGIISFVD
jgi:hypothetical protein